MEIKLNTKNHGLVKIQIDSDDYARLKADGLLEGLWVSKKGQHLYVQNRAKKYLHRLIMNPEKGQVVDHINRDTLNNRKENLNNTSIGDNVRNQRRQSNKTGKTGVSIYPEDPSRFIVRIKEGGKYLHLGIFDDLDKAIKARQEAELRVYGRIYI